MDEGLAILCAVVLVLATIWAVFRLFGYWGLLPLAVLVVWGIVVRP